MTLNDAEKLLKEYYEKALKNDYVHYPVAWSLHQVWKLADNDRESDVRNYVEKHK